MNGKKTAAAKKQRQQQPKLQSLTREQTIESMINRIPGASRLNLSTPPKKLTSTEIILKELVGFSRAGHFEGIKVWALEHKDRYIGAPQDKAAQIMRAKIFQSGSAGTILKVLNKLWSKQYFDDFIRRIQADRKEIPPINEWMQKHWDTLENRRLLLR